MNLNSVLRLFATLRSMISGASASETVIVSAGQLVPADGQVIAGIATVDESAVVGVSTPAVLSPEQGHNFAVAGGLVLEGSLTLRINPSLAAVKN